ncbi:HD domain-containing phosphohydrolase [Ferrimonas pelagia]|uniref:HD domain-containing protein n=1 Tax=Ferrimonas pelagia TaxID=1177826 RepID=A0ABP9EW59_9GAMM
MAHYNNLEAEFVSYDRLLKSVFEALRLELPSLSRISLVKYDQERDQLSTVADYTYQGTPLRRYQAPLRPQSSLAECASTGECRTINDYLAYPLDHEKPHSNWLRQQGYRSSLTVPLYAFGKFCAFVFFNAGQSDVFQPSMLERLKWHVEAIKAKCIAEVALLNVVRGYCDVSSEITRLRDAETGAHLKRMSRYSYLIARDLSDMHGLSDEQINQIAQFAPLHDIGKVGIADEILLKPGKLTLEEREIMQSHVQLGVACMESLLTKHYAAQLPGLSVLLDIIAAHHEMLDGTGYPLGLQGAQIPIAARIVTVADIFDALTSIRPYKSAWSVTDALLELDRLVDDGKIDGDCVASLRRQIDEIEVVRQSLPD